LNEEVKRFPVSRHQRKIQIARAENKPLIFFKESKRKEGWRMLVASTSGGPEKKNGCFDFFLQEVLGKNP
jgi:hypothetical protein